MSKELETTQQNRTTSPFQVMAGRLNIDESAVKNLIINSLMKAKNGANVSDDEIFAFMAISNEYRLNPITKEIYAFNNRGAIQPIVSIDGWLKVINSHPQFDGMEFDDQVNDDGELLAVTCSIFRKDRTKPTQVTEYMNECRGTSEPWKKWPARMLRHKAAIQGARYAFGLSGIVDPDEAERIESTADQPMRRLEPVPEAQPVEYSQEEFDQKVGQWQSLVESGKYTANALIAMVESKGKIFTIEQKMTLASFEVPEATTEEVAQ